MRGWGLALVALLSILIPTEAQEWNSARVLEMIRDARAVRQATVQDSILRSYSSEARGFVYFYLDREDTDERILVKTDQIAVEVFWQAPNQFKQRIVGLRDRKTLPTNIQYHLDHLVVVQDEFGDQIRIGDGDEVAAVMHPVAPGSESVYDFLLTDSVTLDLPATSDTVRVFQIQVRPRDFRLPAVVGNLYLDRSTWSIVRLSFTFTPASYVDDFLDYIRISLENGLWLGRYWLPYRQRLEIRREVPYLDFPAGSVIRGSFQVQNYEINPDLPPTLFSGRPITVLPKTTREAFPFEEDIYAELDEEGMAGFKQPPEMDEIRSLAVSMARERYLSGLGGRTRLFLPSPSISSALRYNRAEGLFLGGGVSRQINPALTMSAYGGYAFGRERPSLQGRISGGERHPSTTLELFWNRPRDISRPVMAGVLNTLSSALLEEDYTDLLFASGAAVRHSFAPGRGVRVEVEGRVEDHRPARNVVDSDPHNSGFRAVLPTEKGTWTSLGLRGSFPTPVPNLTLAPEVLTGSFAGSAFGRVGAGLRYEARRLTGGQELFMDLEGSRLLGHPPRQAHFWLGGRGTTPGYPFRAYEGDAYWLFRTEASMDLIHPFVRLRAFGAGGQLWRADPPYDPDFQPLHPGPETFFSLGMGLGLAWDVLRLDFARGMRGAGDWEVILSVNPEFWPWL